MKILGKTLMVNFGTEVKLGNNDAIELTLMHQAFIDENNTGGLNICVELSIDIINVKFLGIEIGSSYGEFEKFKTHLGELGIDLDELIDEKEKELNEKEIENQLRMKFANFFK